MLKYHDELFLQSTVYIVMSHNSNLKNISIQYIPIFFIFLHFWRHPIFVTNINLSWTTQIAPYSTFQISFSVGLPFTLFARGLFDALGLSKTSPSLSVSDNWASSSLEFWELSHFSSEVSFSSLLLSSARQLLVLRRVLDRRISWSFSHSFLNRWTGPEIVEKPIL